MSDYRYQMKDFSLDNSSLLLAEALFHNANGYLGVRANFEEGYPDGYETIRGQYLNGLYDFVPMPQAEKLCGLTEEKQTMVNAADTQGIKLYLEGEEFSMFTGEVLSSERSFDLKKGVTCREVVWRSPRGRTVRIQIRRMASFTVLPLFLIEYSVTPLNFQGEIQWRSVHNGDFSNYFNAEDPRVAGAAFQHLLPVVQKAEDGVTYMLKQTAASGLQICAAVKNVVWSEAGVIDRKLVESAQEFTERIHVRVRENETVTLYKYSILCESIRYEQPLTDAREIMARTLAVKPGELYRDQERYLAAFWERSETVVEGDEELCQALHYNLYQLMASAGKDCHSNIAAKGLSGEGYEGHYFWDTEMYIQPFFILTGREIAANLIRNRYQILDYARQNARILGHEKGAAYPWRTIMGKECSGHYPSGSAQYHISGDVAYAVVSYYLATKDLLLMEECGVEILIETARLWMDLGNFYRGKFYLNEVTGPDEYTCLVNNNYYTNAVAKYNLEWAVKGVELLAARELAAEVIRKTGVTGAELEDFRRAAERMYLPYDEELGINPQDDSFLQKKRWDLRTIPAEKKPLLLHYHPMYLYRFQICKQADTVLAHFILEDMQDLATIRKSFAYYEQVTTHDSSLSTCIFSIVAAKLGLLEKACEYFGASARLDLENTHQNTRDGIHTANMGGSYMAIVYGFGGLRIKERGLEVNPLLPPQWSGYRFRITYEDAGIEISVRREGVRIKLLAGSARTIRVYGYVYQLTDEVVTALNDKRSFTKQQQT